MACVAAIRRVVPEAEVILYSSVARGDEPPDSDIDLFVLVPQAVTPSLRRALHAQLYEVGLQADCIISAIVRQKSAWHSPPLNYTPLYQAVEDEGVRL